jgi:hypothetical protein
LFKKKLLFFAKWLIAPFTVDEMINYSPIMYFCSSTHMNDNQASGWSRTTISCLYAENGGLQHNHTYPLNICLIAQLHRYVTSSDLRLASSAALSAASLFSSSSLSFLRLSCRTHIAEKWNSLVQASNNN